MKDMKKMLAATPSLLRLACLALVALLVAGCATGPQIRTDYDHGANFAAYHTYGFYEPLGTAKAGYQSLVTQALKQATRQQMESRGYRYSETNADLLINFHAKLALKTQVTQMPPPPVPVIGAYRLGFYGGWAGYGAWGTQVDQYTQGTIIVEMIDRARAQLVWEGMATARVTGSMQDDPQTAIQTAVNDIFAKYTFHAGG